MNTNTTNIKPWKALNNLIWNKEISIPAAVAESKSNDIDALMEGIATAAHRIFNLNQEVKELKAENVKILDEIYLLNQEIKYLRGEENSMMEEILSDSKTLDDIAL